MLLGALIFLVLAILCALITYTSKQSTTVLVAKVLFHVFLFFFLALLFMYFLNSLPPPARDNTMLPIG